jgi:hypothetical protein
MKVPSLLSDSKAFRFGVPLLKDMEMPGMIYRVLGNDDAKAFPSARGYGYPEMITLIKERSSAYCLGQSI